MHTPISQHKIYTGTRTKTHTYTLTHKLAHPHTNYTRCWGYLPLYDNLPLLPCRNEITRAEQDKRDRDGEEGEAAHINTVYFGTGWRESADTLRCPLLFRASRTAPLRFNYRRSSRARESVTLSNQGTRRESARTHTPHYRAPAASTVSIPIPLLALLPGASTDLSPF